MPKHSFYKSVLALNLMVAAPASAERYNALIDFGRAYISGVCIIRSTEGGKIGCLFNEFGLSALDFTYDAKKDKVKIGNITPKLNKWYIRHTLKRDLRAVIHNLEAGDSIYQNTKRGITYKLSPITTENYDSTE